ncbi:MAG: hypothetical protein U0L18_07240 [Acutalibacteraceae bacterium]|nr:hypothetical protein [Acutalibacteraceae bacterium]
MSKNHKRNKRKANSKVNKDKKKPCTKVNEGVSFFNQIGKIYIGLGIGSFFLLGFVSTLPQDYEKYNIPLCFGIWGIISVLFILIGIIPILLGKYNKKYQIWIEKERASYRKKLLDIELKKKKIGR